MMTSKRKALMQVCALSVLLSLSQVSAADDMTMIADNISIASTFLQEWMPNTEYNPTENEFVVMWHASGIRQKDGPVVYSAHGARLAPDGARRGSLINIVTPVPFVTILPIPAYNPYTNEYLVTYSIDLPGRGLDASVVLIDHLGNFRSDPIFISTSKKNDLLANIVFCSKKRQYMVVWYSNRTGDGGDVYGAVIDERGRLKRPEFLINKSAGGQINPYICYNPIDDTCLVNWEDFRNVKNWRENGDMYGALIDSDGNVLVNDIAIRDDHGTDDDGDQRHNWIVHNPDKNEFLVAWTDNLRPSFNNGGAAGRIIRANGTPAGDDFIISDEPGIQLFPHAVYVPEKKKYFVTWEDGRNNDDPNAYWRDFKNLDIYGAWLNADGKKEGDDIAFCTKPGVQRYSKLVYNPLMERVLVVWQDVLDEDVPFAPNYDQHILELGGNVEGAVYGAPSFISARVLDAQTMAPVQGAQIQVSGGAYQHTAVTNKGGWFNIKKADQKKDTYSIYASKEGYTPAVSSVRYAGKALETTVHLKK